MLVLKLLGAERLEIRVPKSGLTVGRSTECDYVVEDPRVSRKHARFLDGGQGTWLVEDLGSTHRTRVNGTVITSPRRLEAGDIVQLGGLAFEATLAQDTGLSTPTLAGALPWMETGAEPITFRAEELRNQWLQIPPEDELWQRLHRVHVNYLLEIAQTLNLAASVEDIFSKVRQAVFGNLQFIDRLALLVDERGTGELSLLQTGSRSSDMAVASDSDWISQTIVGKVFSDRLAIQSPNAQIDERFGGESSIVRKKIGAVLAVPLWNADQVVGVLYADGNKSTRDWEEEGKRDLGFFSALGNLVATSVQRWILARDLSFQQELRLRLERYHSPSVIRQLLESHSVGEEQLRPRFSEVSVLFADIVGFTDLTELLPAEDVAALLNRFFSEMTELVFEEGGTLDKFIGDCVMAFFGAPESQSDHADRAVRVARQMLKRVPLLNSQGAFASNICLRVAINSGRAVVGDVGSPKRMDFTVLGSTVNLASRIEEICPPSYCLISEATFRDLGSPEGWQDFGIRRLRGFSEPVRLFGLKPEVEG